MLKVFFLKFLKFCAVGGSGMIVDFGLTYIFKEKVKINKYAANTIGFIMAATSNYVLNRFWTFESQNPHYILEFGKFLGIAMLGLGINTLVLWFFVSKVRFNFYMSKFIAICVVTLWNFFVNVIFTFQVKY